MKLIPYLLEFLGLVILICGVVFTLYLIHYATAS